MKRNQGLIAAAVVLIVLPSPSWTRSNFTPAKNTGGPQCIRVLDGSNVHNVGELQMHVGNWGLFGSLPGSLAPYAEQPSAQWPAGSGVEYLFGAGLWVGALKNGVPAVSTSLGYTGGGIEFEFLPSQDTRDIIYRSSEGISGGNRTPSPVADDDGDGRVDEDWRNGYDDDGDGKVDEDFAAISRQMFSCQYDDDEPAATSLYPQHNPLHLHVRQESYQWEEDRYDDFVGIQFYITNTGGDVLEDVYVGFFADGDVGQRGTENYWEDDGTGLTSNTDCLDLGPVSMDIAYVYDVDGDDGRATGYMGVMFLGHTTDPTGEHAPKRVGISTYSNFSGNAAYADGGDPTTDPDRYDLLSSRIRKRNADIPRDYRMLMAAGPFKELMPGSTLVFQTAFVVGPGGAGMLANGGSAQLTFQGAWFDLDHDRTTGVGGRETPVRGPADGVLIDTCLHANQSPINVPRGQTVWINNDCARERLFELGCGYDPNGADTTKYMTGINGAESQVFWIVGTAPPPPKLRVDGSARDGVAIYWDNFSQTQLDVKTQEPDFEGYRLFRADGWTRPFGTSARNGPSAEQWKMLLEADVVNGFGRDTGLDRFRYEPLQHAFSAVRRRDLIESIKQYLSEFPGQAPPCPQGVTPEQCDTLTALAAWELGLPEGRQYYRYVDRAVHRGRPYFYAVTASDHAYDRTTGKFGEGKVGDPSSNFAYVEPVVPSQPDYRYREDDVYVVPNPATAEAMQPWTLLPNNDDPTGLKVEFRNLPADRGTIHIFSLAGDLVDEISFDGRTGIGTARWDLVSRNGQDVTSGVYLFSVTTDTNVAFKRKIGKFVVIR